MEEKSQADGIFTPVLRPCALVQGLFFLLGMSPSDKKRKGDKKMKKILSIALILVMLFALASCGATVGEQGDVTFVIENRDGTYSAYKMYLEDVENKDKGALGVIESLNSRENNPLPVDMNGTWMNSIGTLIPDSSKNEFISIYTSLARDMGDWDGVLSLEYEGVTLTQSNFGIDGMSVEKGTVILFRIETW
jgi:hypothetical protein